MFDDHAFLARLDEARLAPREWPQACNKIVQDALGADVTYRRLHFLLRKRGFREWVGPFHWIYWRSVREFLFLPSPTGNYRADALHVAQVAEFLLKAGSGA